MGYNMLFEQKPQYPNCYKESSKPHKFCPGCGHGIALKALGYAIDETNIAKKMMLGIDIGCSLLAWDFFDVNTVQTHHGRTVPVLSGFKTMAPNYIGIAYVGDGGAYAIGLQALLTAAHRNDPIMVVVINNTLYGMTGGQMAPTTLKNEITATSTEGKQIDPIFGAELVKTQVANNAYVARGIVSNPLGLKEVFKKAIKNQINNKSFSFVEVLSMCPVNWKKNAKESLLFLEKDMKDKFKIGEI
jgi:2-oxoglutarate ferredoxin oxidoreductase subunit beta